MSELANWMVAVSVWLTPMRGYVEGRFVYYGPDSLVAEQIQYREFDWEGCGVSGMSPANIGQIVWLRVGDSQWYGPCLIVDASARHHFYRNVYVNREVVEVPDSVRKWFGFRATTFGEVFVGLCPPTINEFNEVDEKISQYRPKLRFDYGQDRHPLFDKFEQQKQIECSYEVRREVSGRRGREIVQRR